MINKKEYLGDSVYMEMEIWNNELGYQLILTTENGSEDASNRIVLDDGVLNRLISVLKRNGLLNG